MNATFPPDGLLDSFHVPVRILICLGDVALAPRLHDAILSGRRAAWCHGWYWEDEGDEKIRDSVSLEEVEQAIRVGKLYHYAV